MFTDGVIKNAKGQSLVYGKSGKLTTQTGYKEVLLKMIVVRRNSTNTLQGWHHGYWFD
ncbi:MAG: hypothetical protein ACLU93_01110 [Streptococcus sp.]